MFGVYAFGGAKYKNEIVWEKALEEEADKKQSFVNLLLPIIDAQNQKILQDREFIKNFFNKYRANKEEISFERVEFSRFLDIAQTYKIKDIFEPLEYYEKIDVIPASLALSQAALESGWGSSRVYLNSNNLFGQKAFGAKKYLKARGSSIKYAAFDNIRDAVGSYMTNLNSHDAYEEFRKKRALSRVKNSEFTGLKAAKTLANYSEVNNYGAMLSNIIKTYFSAYDKAKNIASSNAIKAGFM